MHSTVAGHLSFQFLVVKNEAAVNTLVHGFFWAYISFGGIVMYAYDPLA